MISAKETYASYSRHRAETLENTLISIEQNYTNRVKNYFVIHKHAVKYIITTCILKLL